MGKIEVNKSRCKGCELCVMNCPFHLIRLGSGMNENGYRLVEQTEPEKCTSCTLCAVICPDMAITVYR